jgi:ribosomal protein S18 acetylase RimI-like enzyme
MEVAIGTPGDVAAVTEVATLCVAQMRASGIDQWDEIYPGHDVFAADAESGHLYVLRSGGIVAGSIVLNEIQAPEYTTVAWRWPDHRPLVIHRLCVRPDYQRQGAGHRLMDFAESFAASRAYPSIRLDTYTGNPRAVTMYERRGYLAAGFVRFPRRRLPFICMEKAL